MGDACDFGCEVHENLGASVDFTNSQTEIGSDVVNNAFECEEICIGNPACSFYVLVDGVCSLYDSHPAVEELEAVTGTSGFCHLTNEPTAVPTVAPSGFPTASPTMAPTNFPSTSPITSNPTVAPSQNPTVSPTAGPSAAPVMSTLSPTQYPTIAKLCPLSVVDMRSCEDYCIEKCDASPDCGVTDTLMGHTEHSVCDCVQPNGAPPPVLNDLACAYIEGNGAAKPWRGGRDQRLGHVGHHSRPSRVLVLHASVLLLAEKE